MRKRKKGYISTLLYHAFIWIFGFFMLYPVLWLISSSFKGHADIFQRAHHLIPTQWEFSNYIEGWKGFGGISFAVFFKNSFIVATLTTIGQVVSSAFVAYGFSRIRFKGKKILFGCMITTMLLPSQVLIIPQYIYV